MSTVGAGDESLVHSHARSDGVCPGRRSRITRAAAPRAASYSHRFGHEDLGRPDSTCCRDDVIITHHCQNSQQVSQGQVHPTAGPHGCPPAWQIRPKTGIYHGRVSSIADRPVFLSLLGLVPGEFREWGSRPWLFSCLGTSARIGPSTTMEAGDYLLLGCRPRHSEQSALRT
jgi:hypothetical protein